jgi:hypothetical protein
MARRLPKPLIPVLVGVSAATLGLLAMTPSFAGTTTPMDPVSPTTATSTTSTPTPGPIPSLDEDGNLPISIRPSKPDPMRDPTQSPSGVGSCTACLGVDP